MAKFQLLAGTHSHGGVVWDAAPQGAPPTIVESDIDLQAYLGPEKFLRVDDDVPASQGRATTVVEGSHAPKAKPLEKGFRAPLAVPQPETTAQKVSADKAKKASKPQVEEDEDEDEEFSDAAESELGDDATDEFPEAEKKGLRVYKKRGFYYPASEDDPNTAVSEKGLRKKDLKAFVRKYEPDAEEEDEDDDEE